MISGGFQPSLSLAVQSKTSLVSSNSHGNSFVHSLSVTLGNHAILLRQPYNCPCPNGHVSLKEFGHLRFQGRYGGNHHSITRGSFLSFEPSGFWLSGFTAGLEF